MTEAEIEVSEKLDASSTAPEETSSLDIEPEHKDKPAEQTPLTDKNDSATKDADTEVTPERKSISKRVQEAREYNNRSRGDRGRKQNDRGPPRQDYRKNVKSDLTSQEESSDPVEIRKQVEFYFSDSNLLNDEFLYSKVDGPSNLPVPISVVHSFKRMRRFQPLSAVIAALKDSTTLNVVDNDACIKRKYPLPEDIKDKPMREIQKVYEDKSMARSVYAKGFGDEEPGTQFDIEAFFAEYGPTNSVRLRRQFDKVFKGSVFVEFDSEEAQKKFLALDPKPQWKGKDLLIKSKKQYCDDKVADIEAGRIQPKAPRESSYKDKRGNDNRDWRVRRNEDRASGFKDRNGRQNHRGFGSRGRGRGGYGRDGDRRNGRDPPKQEKDERNISVPAVRASTPSPTRAPKAEDSTAKAAETSEPASRAEDPTTKAVNAGEPSGAPETDSTAIGTVSDTAAATTVSSTEPSKKRQREDADETQAEESAPKKLDTKSEGSDS